MSKRARRTFDLEQKREAVEAYVSGRQSAADVAAELNISQGLLYKWKATLEELDRSKHLSELQSDGGTLAQAKKIQQQEDEIAIYQKKIAELTVINDLLKKLQTPSNSQSESELSGLIGTIKKIGSKKKA